MVTEIGNNRLSRSCVEDPKPNIHLEINLEPPISAISHCQHHDKASIEPHSPFTPLRYGRHLSSGIILIPLFGTQLDALSDADEEADSSAAVHRHNEEDGDIASPHQNGTASSA